MRKLDIFLRTCEKNSIRSDKRCVSDPRSELVRKCVHSLVSSVEKSIADTKLWIVDDNSSEDFVSWLKETTANIDSEIVNVELTGHNTSAAKTFQMAKENTRDLLYVVEDDYFHHPAAIDTLINSWRILSEQLSTDSVGIHPYDCVDRYDNPEPARVLYHLNMYWRTITKTTYTVMLHKDVFSQYYDVFNKLAYGYGAVRGINEDTTINLLYNNGVSQGGPIFMFSPMPSLAVHLEHRTPTNLLNGFYNWKQVWASYTYK